MGFGERFQAQVTHVRILAHPQPVRQQTRRLADALRHAGALGYKLQETLEAQSLLLGRVSFEGFSAAWSQREGDQPPPGARFGPDAGRYYRFSWPASMPRFLLCQRQPSPTRR
jgi:hypothetical protein